LFWTCAVFYALNQLFFRNPDTYPFTFTFNYPLDNMQLCCRPEVREQFHTSKLFDWRVASHPSPEPLIDNALRGVVAVTKAYSNADAAKRCTDGEVEACITTAQAATIHGLTMIHEFGSPVMVFFAGTTEHGMRVLLGQ